MVFFHSIFTPFFEKTIGRICCPKNRNSFINSTHTRTSRFFCYRQITKLKIDSNPFAKGFRDSSRLSDFERWVTLWWQKRVVDRLISGPAQGNTSSCLLPEPLRRAIDHRSLEEISVQIESNVATNGPGNRLLSSPFYTENCFRVSFICGGCGTALSSHVETFDSKDQFPLLLKKMNRGKRREALKAPTAT